VSVLVDHEYIAEHRAELLSIAAQGSLSRYIELMSPTLPQPKHIHDLIESLEAVEQGVCDRLMVFMPPRHEKSVTVSEHFPAWLLGKHPDWRVILASYSADLAYSFSRKARNQLFDARYPFKVSVSQGSSAVSAWDIQGSRGGMVSAGVGGPIMGKGGNVVIIDDPFKNYEEAYSETTRQAVWDWYTSTLYTRLEQPNAIVVVMTRWHEDDLAGRLLSATGEFADKWRIVNFPAIGEDGTRLWPERFDYDRIRANITARDWNSLYQQQPIPDEGVLFKREWFRTYQPQQDGYVVDGEFVPAKSVRTAVICDLAASMKESADYTVIGAVGVTPAGELLLLDLIRKHMEGPDIVPALERMHARWGADDVWIEKVGFQLTIIQAAIRAGLPVRELVPDKDKLARAFTVAALMEGGRVFFRQGADWLPELMHEALAFPNGRHDDQVDVLSYAGIVGMEKARAVQTSSRGKVASARGER